MTSSPQAQLRALAYAAIKGQSPTNTPQLSSWMSQPMASLALGLVHDFLTAAQCNSTVHVLNAECHLLKPHDRHAAAHALVCGVVWGVFHIMLACIYTFV